MSIWKEYLVVAEFKLFFLLVIRMVDLLLKVLVITEFHCINQKDRNVLFDVFFLCFEKEHFYQVQFYQSEL